jgi:hypothetical protein
MSDTKTRGKTRSDKKQKEEEQEANVPRLVRDHHGNIQIGLSASLVSFMPSAVTAAK